MKTPLIGLIFGAAIATSAVAQADVEARIQPTSLSFAGGQNYTNAVLMVTGPNEYEHEATAARGLPIFRLQSAGRLLDGYYQFSLVAATDKTVPIKKPIDNGRGPDAPTTQKVPFSMYGAFRVEKGRLLEVESGGESGGDSDG